MFTPIRWVIVKLFFFGLMAALPACTTQTNIPPPIPVSVQLQWTHQAQFVGFYAAAQNGDYSAAGLDVTLNEGGPQVNFIDQVLTGQAQFGVSGADQLLLARAGGKPVRAIAVIYRRSPIVLVAKTDTGITTPQDFAGRTVRVTSIIAPTLHAITAKVGLQPGQYTEITTLPSEISAFDSGQADVWGVYRDGFGITLEEAGYALNTIYPDDYGVHFYADTLFTTDELIASNPDLVRRFLAATLTGWTYAVEHPAETGQLVLRYNPEANPSLENKRMIIMLPLVNTGEDFIGWMKPNIWAGMEQTLRAQGILTAPLDPTQVYTTQFLQEIYAP